MRMRMTITSVHEYDADPLNYAGEVNKPPEEVTVEDIIKLDTEAAKEDPSMFAGADNTKTTVVVEKVG